MFSFSRDLFRAIHEGKWLSLEYENKLGEVSRFWAAVRDLDPVHETMEVDGMHLVQHTIEHFPRLYLSSVRSAQIIEGTFAQVNGKLIEDIAVHPERYQKLFGKAFNLKILHYLEQCNRLDFTPYYKDYTLVHLLDDSVLKNADVYPLNREQFCTIVNYFYAEQERKTEAEVRRGQRVRNLALNVLSVDTPQGLYVLAYREIGFDIKERVLRPNAEITVCREFALDGEKRSVTRFLDADDLELLRDFEGNAELIKDRIQAGGDALRVDDRPFLLGLEGQVAIDLHEEYNGIVRMISEGKATVPIRAFFGDLLGRPHAGRKTRPLIVMQKKANLDQLLSISNAMRFPVSYTQGPPGTGKTNTIVNTLVTAFFNEMTVLCSSYNNIPIDGVFEKLCSLKYRGRPIPFPVLRIGNQEKTQEAIDYIRRLYEYAKGLSVFTQTLDKRKSERVENSRRLSELLQRYDRLLSLKEHEAALKEVLSHQEKCGHSMQLIAFEADLRQRQLEELHRQQENLGDVREEDALALLEDTRDDFMQYLYYTSARHLQRLGGPKYERLRDIIYQENKEARLEAFWDFLKRDENLSLLQKVFPIIITTCIGAHRLGTPAPHFDLTVMDEASQCNTAVSLVPILRGESMMLVGDPQQLSPVILLDPLINEMLKARYRIEEEYDYRKNSIYKVFLACDSVSDEVLLHNHYRCDRRIIEFNNQKYYSGKLRICTGNLDPQPLVFVDSSCAETPIRNTSPAEVDEVLAYCDLHPDKSIGIITPFVNQRAMIEEGLKKRRRKNISVGTVHSFQGEEKDVILFSTAITGSTKQGTYNWLKNSRELINVATSRAREKLIVLADMRNVERLHADDQDDLYELIEYVRTNGQTRVSPREGGTRALGIKPFSTETEEAFMTTLTHALEIVSLTEGSCVIHKEVPISQVFAGNVTGEDLFYTGRFDFVIYQKSRGGEVPLLAIELDGKEHFESEAVMARDRAKRSICRAHNMELIRVENAYARRYAYIRDILESYFRRVR
ncbi:MAG: DUF2726 domain-containing protein [Lachnospiraceae bacterium]|nr:DUF2726 domain-containing protein [Lachnospiraceae bacterium]